MLHGVAVEVELSTLAAIFILSGLLRLKEGMRLALYVMFSLPVLQNFMISFEFLLVIVNKKIQNEMGMNGFIPG